MAGKLQEACCFCAVLEMDLSTDESRQNIAEWKLGTGASAVACGEGHWGCRSHSECSPGDRAVPNLGGKYMNT